MDYFEKKIELKDLNYGNLKKLGYENHRLKLTQSITGLKRTALIIAMLSKSKNGLTNSDKDFQKEFRNIETEINEIFSSEKELDSLKNVGLYITYSKNDFHLPDKSITVTQYIFIQKLAILSIELISWLMAFYESKGGFSKYKKELRNLS